MTTALYARADAPLRVAAAPVVSCRFLYVVGQLGAGGLERQLCYLLSALDRARHRPAVVVWNRSADEVHAARIRDLDVPLWFLPANLRRPAKLAALRHLIRELKPEVVHSCTFFTNFAAHWAARGTAAAVGSVRGDFAWTKRDCGLVRGSLCARWPRAQIFNSASAAEAARRCRGPLAPRQLFVIPNALDLERYRARPFAVSHRTEILGIGSLLPVKRWDRAIAAARALKKGGYRFRLRIAGGGPLRASLEKQVVDLDVRDCVDLLGYRTDVGDLLGTSHFLVHTSDSEGCPNTVMEAMACGRAVVATDAGDAAAIVEDGKSGFVVRRGDDAALAERMSRLIERPDLCRLMGEAGRVEAERRFTLERLAGATLAAYRAAGWRERA